MRLIIVTSILMMSALQEVSPADKPAEWVKASKLRHFALRRGYKRSFRDVLSVYRTAKHLGATCMPGVLTQEDFLAIAFVESAFNPKAVGGHGEVGVWQILHYKERMKRVGGTNPFDVATNGEMACQVIQEKFKHRRGHMAKAVQSYNGYRPTMKTLPYYNRVTKTKRHLVSSLW